jgi:ABC-type bacteriocin/lantibiotic exporter with double-glycine peptidase domain
MFKSLKKALYIFIISVGKKKIISIIFLSFFLIFIELIGIASFIPVLSVITERNDFIKGKDFFSYFSGIIDFNNINIILIFLLFVFIFKNLLVFFITRYLTFSNIKLSAILTDKILNIYLNQPYNFFLSNNSSKLVTICRSELSIVAKSMDAYINLFIETLVFFFIVIGLLYFSTKITIFIILFFLFFAFFYNKIMKKKIYKSGRDIQINSIQTQKILTEIFGSIKEIILLNKKNLFLDYFNSYLLNSAKSQKIFSIFAIIPRLWMETMFIGGFVLIVFFYYTSVNNLSELTNLFGLFAISSLRLMPALNRILSLNQRIIASRASIELVYSHFNDLEKSQINKLISHNNRFVFRKIDFNKIYFKYNNSNQVIKNLSLSIKKGDFICIFGKSGVGKSTFLDILLGLTQPDSGSVRVNDRNLDLFRTAWHSQIGYVPQNPYLLDASIKDNITMIPNDSGVNLKILKKSLDVSQLSSFFNDFPQGIETFVGEKGVRISGGQKQRICISRSIYACPKVLILDEATSSLDEDSELKILKMLKKLNLKDKLTVVFITHKKSLFSYFNKIYKLDKGTLKLY